MTFLERQPPEGVVFDLDGVLVDTARIHAHAWKEMFDGFLQERGHEEHFDMEDYLRYVDGRPRYRGVASFLESRGIDLPPGDPSDPPGMLTQAGLGNLKNQKFLERLEGVEIAPLPGVEELLDSLSSDEVPMAVVSSSRNTDRILPRGVRSRVDVVMGGLDLDEQRIAGKPEPDMFIRASLDLGLDPRVTAIVEDSTAGVIAGRRGGFSIVIGIGEEDASSSITQLADVTVAGVSELPGSLARWPTLLRPPRSALDHLDAIRFRVEDGEVPIYIGEDEGELLAVRKTDGVGVLIDPEPSPMSWADFSVPGGGTGEVFLAHLGQRRD